jgi:hypothetical protein
MPCRLIKFAVIWRGSSSLGVQTPGTLLQTPCFLSLSVRVTYLYSFGA